MSADGGWRYVRLLAYRANTRRLERRYSAVFAVPWPRWTFMGYGVNRQHERYFR